jgi:hypothetical protein
MDEISITRKISKPITIQSNNKSEQYSLNNMRFDPIQNSPPTQWKIRLNQRVGNSPIKNIMVMNKEIAIMN